MTRKAERERAANLVNPDIDWSKVVERIPLKRVNREKYSIWSKGEGGWAYWRTPIVQGKLARYGGEFLQIILPGCESASLFRLADENTEDGFQRAWSHDPDHITLKGIVRARNYDRRGSRDCWIGYIHGHELLSLWRGAKDGRALE